MNSEHFDRNPEYVFACQAGLIKPWEKITVYQEVEDHSHMPVVTAGHKREQRKCMSPASKVNPEPLNPEPVNAYRI